MGLRGPTGRVVATALAATTLASAPALLLAALAATIRGELDFTLPALGASFAVFFGTSAVFAIPAGRVSERGGPALGLTAAAAAGGCSLLLIAWVAHGWLVLTLCLALSGAGAAFAHVSSNVSVSARVAERRQGLAFGIKQCAMPLGALLAGTVGTLGATLAGWRSVFAGAGAIALAFAIVVPRRALRAGLAPGGRDGDGATAAGTVHMSALMILALGAGIGAAGMNALTAFYVESLIHVGLSPAAAGVWFGASGLLGVVGRITSGWAAGRREGGSLVLTASMLAAGALGVVLLGAGDDGPLLALATLLAFGSGWAWTGVFTYAVVKTHRAEAASASGITMTGMFAGGVVGPPLVGFTIAETSYLVGWCLDGLLLACAAGLILVGRRRLRMQLGIAAAAK